MNASIVLATLFLVLGISRTAATIASECDPADRAFVCGVQNAEDLVRLSGTPWVIASHLSYWEDNRRAWGGFGPLEATRIDTHEVTRLYPEPQARADWERKIYPDCSMPPESLSSHGLNVRPLGSNKFRLYVINHSGRESIEIIDVAVRGSALQSTWRGCLLIPGGARANNVAPLAKDGIVVSRYGEGAAIWRPRAGWNSVVGSAGADNGIEVSKDGKWLFAVLFAKKAIVRIPIDGGKPQTVFQSQTDSFDNLRWGEDGYLYATGFLWPELEECSARKESTVCDAGFSVIQIDPESLAPKEVLRSSGIKGAFGAASTALQVGKEFWIGTIWGDRIAILGPNTEPFHRTGRTGRP